MDVDVAVHLLVLKVEDLVGDVGRAECLLHATITSNYSSISFTVVDCSCPNVFGFMNLLRSSSYIGSYFRKLCAISESILVTFISLNLYQL